MEEASVLPMNEVGMVPVGEANNFAEASKDELVLRYQLISVQGSGFTDGKVRPRILYQIGTGVDIEYFLAGARFDPLKSFKNNIVVISAVCEERECGKGLRHEIIIIT